MKKNVGNVDKAVRILAAVLIGVLAYLDLINGVLATILLIVAGIFIATSFIGFCPLYYPFGISTIFKKKH